MDTTVETGDDTENAHRPQCTRDDRPVRRCTAAAGWAFGRLTESAVRYAAFWTAIAFPVVYVVGSLDGVASGLPSGWLAFAIAANLLLLRIGHPAYHPD